MPGEADDDTQRIPTGAGPGLPIASSSGLGSSRPMRYSHGPPIPFPIWIWIFLAAIFVGVPVLVIGVAMLLADALRGRRQVR